MQVSAQTAMHRLVAHAAGHRGRTVAQLIVTAALAYLAQQAWQFYSRRRLFKRMAAAGIPLMHHSWLLGHLGVMKDYAAEHPKDTNSVMLEPWLAKNRKKYFPGLDDTDSDSSRLPPVVYLDLYPFTSFPMAIVCDPDMSAQLLSPHPGAVAGITRGPVQQRLFTPLTDNDDIFSMEGPEWKRWRAKLNPAFSNRNITALVPEMLDEIEVFARELEKSVGRGDDKDNGWGEVFQMSLRTGSLTVDVIGRALVDRRLHDQTTPTGNAAKVAILNILDLIRKPRHVLRRRLPPKIGYLFDRAYINENQAVVNGLFQEGIDEAVGKMSPHGQKSSDTNDLESRASTKKSFVDVVCSAFTTVDNDGTVVQDPATQKAILGHLKVLMFAGYDTTATTICWIFKMMQDNPRCLAAMREEHDRVLGALSPDSSEEDYVSAAAAVLRESPHLLNSLPYTQAVIKETLRIHPVSPILRQNVSGGPTAKIHLVHRPTGQEYPTEGFAITDGTAWIGVNPEYWPRADEFLPERWLALEDESDPLHPTYPGNYAELFGAFGAGPRRCIGMELAMTEMKLACALVMRKFDVREAWEAWDKARNQVEGPKDTLHGERLYSTGIGPAHLKDDMPVQARLVREASS